MFVMKPFIYPWQAYNDSHIWYMLVFNAQDLREFWFKNKGDIESLKLVTRVLNMI